jgi:hypothetical protein
MENGALVASHSLPDVPPTWQINGTHDFDHDGDADIPWRHDDGAVVTWEMQNGAFVANHNFGVVSNTWQISGTAEFDL